MGNRLIRIYTFLLVLLFSSSFFSQTTLGKTDIQTVPIGVVSTTSSGLNGYDVLSSFAVSDLNQYMLDYNHPYRFQVTILNSSGNDIDFLNAIKQLNTQGVKIVISDGTDSMLQASSAYLNANNMLMLATRSKANNLALSNDGIFRLKSAQSESTKSIAQMMWSYGIKYACVIQRNDGWANDVFTIFDAEWRKLGGGYAGEKVVYSDTTSVFGTHLDDAEAVLEAAVQAYKVDKIGVLLLSGAEVLTIASQIYSRPYLLSVPWFTTDTQAKNPLILGGSTNVPATLHLYSPLDAIEQTQMYTNLSERYFNATGAQMNELESLTYDWFWLAGLSVLDTGSTNVSMVRGALNATATRYIGVAGKYLFNINGDRANQIYDIWGYRFIENKLVSFLEGWIESPTEIYWLSRLKPAITLELKAEKDVVPGSSSVVLLGKTLDTRFGSNITIQYWDPENVETKIITKIDRYGKFNTTISSPRLGMWHYQATYLGDQTFRESSSLVSQFNVLRTATTLSLNSSTTEIVKDISVKLTGSITPPLSGASLTIIKKDPQGMVTNTSILTNSKGNYSAILQLAKAGNWTLSVSYDGDFSYLQSISNSVSVTVLKKESSINVLLSEQTSVEGDEVSAYGQLSPVLPNTAVVVEAITPAGATINSTAITASDGRYSVVFEPAMIGVWKFKALFMGDDTYLPSESELVPLTVTRLPPTADIKIIVNDSQGNPLQGSRVESTSQPVGQAALIGTTGTDGSVTFLKVKPGDYSFYATKTDYQGETSQIKAAESQTTEKTIILTKIVQPGIPGFPLASIILGIGVAIATILLIRRK